MRNASIITVLCCTMALLACNDGPTQPTGELPAIAANGAEPTTVHSSVDITGNTLFNPCTNEVMEHVGVIRFVTHLNANPAGGWQIVGQGNMAGLYAVGQTTGMVYRVVGPQKFGIVINTPRGDESGILGGEIATVAQVNRWIATGPTADLVFEAILHLIVNANGEITAAKFNIGFSCH